MAALCEGMTSVLDNLTLASFRTVTSPSLSKPFLKQQISFQKSSPATKYFAGRLEGRGEKSYLERSPTHECCEVSVSPPLATSQQLL